MKKMVLLLSCVLAVAGCKPPDSLQTAIRMDRNDCLEWPDHRLGYVCPEDEEWIDAMRYHTRRNIEFCEKSYSWEAIKYPDDQVRVTCTMARPGGEDFDINFRVKKEWGLIPEWEPLFEEGSTKTRITWRAEGW